MNSCAALRNNMKPASIPAFLCRAAALLLAWLLAGVAAAIVVTLLVARALA